MDDKEVEMLNYSRRQYDDVLDWYNSADSKAQVILAINGGFIAFVSGTVFAKPDDLISIVDEFNSITWILVILMVVSLITSIGASIYCLWSRICTGKELRKKIDDETRAYSLDANILDNRYAPSLTSFFLFIEHLDPKIFENTLKSVDTEYEIAALAGQIRALSRNVKVKHLAVNIGFAMTSIALITFFMVAVSYVLEVAK